MRRHLIMITLLFVVGCSDGPSRFPFEDELGRQCTLECGDPCTLICDAEVPETAICPEGLEPDFLAATYTMDEPTLLCVWCFPDAGRPWILADPPSCGRLVCEEAVDCGFSEQICAEGFCWQESSLDP